jgi:hypothetical protein
MDQQKQMCQPIYKVTMYMTPEQWESLSIWSAPHASALDPKCPWLLLIHDGDKREEYFEAFHKSVAYEASETIYTTTSD